MLRVLRYIAIAFACLIVVVLLSALLYRKYLEHKVVARPKFAIISLRGSGPIPE